MAADPPRRADNGRGRPRPGGFDDHYQPGPRFRCDPRRDSGGLPAGRCEPGARNIPSGNHPAAVRRTGTAAGDNRRRDPAACIADRDRSGFRHEAGAPAVDRRPGADRGSVVRGRRLVRAGPVGRLWSRRPRCPSLPSSLSNSGSGTVVRGGAYVLTNAHVVYDDNGAPCRELAVWFTRSFEEEPDDWARAALVAADKRLDLAVLQLEAPVSADRSVRVAAQQLEPGESIRILGYPGAGGLTMTLTRGSYSGMIDHEGEAYIKTDADISEGNSGGAAFDEAGLFIGVPTAGIEQVGLLIPAGVAEQFLNRALES